MATLNQSFESLLPYFARPISQLLASMPRQRARSGAVSALVGLTGASVLAGVALGLLVAPDSGRELRGQLAKSAERFREDVTVALVRLTERVDTRNVVEVDGTAVEQASGDVAAVVVDTASARDNGRGARRATKSARV